MRETPEDLIDASLRCLTFLLMAGMASTLLSPARLETKYIDWTRLLLLVACGGFLVRCSSKIFVAIRKHGWSHSATIAVAFTFLGAAIIFIGALGLFIYWGIP